MGLLDRLGRKKTEDAGQYKEITEYVLANVDLSPEQADMISQRLGIQERYLSLLQEREQGPYRTAYDLGELLSQAWHEKDSRALVRREEVSLERKVESAEPVPVAGEYSLALGYAKVLGRGCLALAKGTYTACVALMKGAYKGVKELAISSLYGLLPGFILGKIGEESIVPESRRLLNNAFAVSYDTAAASTISYLIAEHPLHYGGENLAVATIVGGLIGVTVSGLARWIYTDIICPLEMRGALGPLVVEWPSGLARLVHYGVTSLHAAAKAEAEKVKLQSSERKRLESSTTPASPRMLTSASDEE